MRKQITGEANIDFNIYRRFSEFQIFRSKNPRLRKISLYGFGIVASIMLFFIGLTQRNNIFIFLGGFMILLLVIFSFMTKQVLKKQFGLNEELLKKTQNYVFAPDGFSIEIKDNLHSRQEVFYSDIYMIYEVVDAFYLYRNRKSAFIIPKNGIKKAEPLDLREFLIDKVPPQKYIIVKQ